MGGPSLMVSAIYLVGMLLVFVGERLIGAGSARWLTAAGVALVVIAEALRDLRRRRGEEDRKKVEGTLLLLHLLGVAALALYFVQSDLSSKLFDQPFERGWPRLQVVLAALWPALWLGSVIPTILVELAYASVARAPKLEGGRIRDAMFSGFGLAGALVFAFSVGFVATSRDKKIDLSYFKTAKPGESTRKLAHTLDQPVQVALFFPPANEVHEEVANYFADLVAESKMIEVKEYDHAVDPAKAKELGASGNGIIIVGRGTRREQLSLGLEIESARSQLANLDRDIQKRLLQVARPQRKVYLTVGHGERSGEPANDTDKRATLRDTKDLMYQQGYQVSNLGAGDGLATDVPTDAAVVLVIGPQKPLLAEEAAALGRYVERGGRLMVALDPDAGPAAGMDFKELLGPLGLSYTPVGLANDQVYARKGYQQSDRANIVTGSFSSHPSVTSLGRLGMRAPLVLFGAGSLEEAKDKPRNVSVNFTIHAHTATWNDANGNFAFDAPAEVRKAWELGAAVVRKKPEATKTSEEGRALVLADSDAISDGVVMNPGNAYFLIDGMKWLLGEEAITGEISSEADVPVAHTKKQDVIWFYSTIFLAPALVLGIGFFASRRRRPRRKAGAKETA
ncbi:MAG: ABC transporter [Myxococcales bacterium]|nr:ABC transporter [Myxococcales bacterium]